MVRAGEWVSQCWMKEGKRKSEISQVGYFVYKRRRGNKFRVYLYSEYVIHSPTTLNVMSISFWGLTIRSAHSETMWTGEEAVTGIEQRCIEKM